MKTQEHMPGEITPLKVKFYYWTIVVFGSSLICNKKLKVKKILCVWGDFLTIHILLMIPKTGFNKFKKGYWLKKICYLYIVMLFIV